MGNFYFLAVSILFYSWGGGYLFSLISIILINHFFAKNITSCSGKNFYGLYPKKTLLVLAVSFNLFVLLYFKYTEFLLQNLNTVLIAINFAPILYEKTHHPIGISFIVFSALSFILDIYTGRAGSQNKITNTALYIAFFPKVIAGPIVQYHDIQKQLIHRDINIEKISYGVRRFIIGLGKKVLIADNIGYIVDSIYLVPPDHLTFGLAWMCAISYTLQIYFDFSGYSDMSIGLCKMFGFDICENFNYPYVSLSIREFWQRWHMSLSVWFRDYLYIPMGGNRCAPSRVYFNLITVFLLCGLWHGASWCFVVWGIWHGFFMVVERSLSCKINTRKIFPICHIYALLVIIVGWVIFRSPSLSYAYEMIKTMFGFGSENNSSYFFASYFNKKTILFFLLGIFFSFPVSLRWKKHLKPEHPLAYNFFSVLSIFLLCSMFIMCAIELAGKTYKPFIYLQF